MASSPPSAWEQWVDTAFACGPEEFGSLIEPRRHVLSGWGFPLTLPKSWASPSPMGEAVVMAQAPDKRTRVRLTRQKLHPWSFEQAVAAHERRYFGESRLTEVCTGELTERYAPSKANASLIRTYRARFAYRGLVSTYAIFFSRGPVFYTLVVESEWSRRHPPDFRNIDGILRQFASGSPPGGSPGKTR